MVAEKSSEQHTEVHVTPDQFDTLSQTMHALRTRGESEYASTLQALSRAQIATPQNWSPGVEIRIVVDWGGR